MSNRPYDTRVSVNSLREIIVGIFDSASDSETGADEVMELLRAQRMVAYSSDEHLPLLTTSGRCLIMIMENPDITQRELSVRLGTTEANVQKAIERLTTNSLVQRQKILNRNHYSVNLNKVLSHPDIWRLVVATHEAAEAAPEISEDIR